MSPLLRVRFAAATLPDGAEPLHILAELDRVGALLCAVDAGGLPPLDRLDPVASDLGWTFALPETGELAP